MTADTDLLAAAKALDDLAVSYTEVLRLQEPTPREAVRQKPKAGKMLDYITARYVMKRLDDVCEPHNWQDEYSIGAGGKVACRIGINIAGVGWVWKGDGAGETDIEGEKGSFSDAFKRAGVKWGIARDLYHEDDEGSTSAPVSRPAEQAASAEQYPPHNGPKPTQVGGECPKHHKPWRVGKYGPFCSAKDEEGPRGYCGLKPPAGWVPA